MTFPDFIYFSMIFNDLIQYSMTFQAWNFDLLHSMTFQVFHDPYEPCHINISLLSNQHSTTLINRQVS